MAKRCLSLSQRTLCKALWVTFRGHRASKGPSSRDGTKKAKKERGYGIQKGLG